MDCDKPARPEADETGRTLDPATLLELWDRLGIVVRCGYHPFCACPARRYLEMGQRLIDARGRTELAVQRRQFEVLLQAARDEALPGFWRAVCVDHARVPLGRLESLIAHHDPIACRAFRAALQSAHSEVAIALSRLDDD